MTGSLTANNAAYRRITPRFKDRLVREIERYLIEARDRPVHIAGICKRFKIHRRTLHRAFADVFGVPPIAYLRERRLNDVRAALLTAGPGATVGGIAREHGFDAPGRFATAYRRQFGERPSQTLHHAGNKR